MNYGFINELKKFIEKASLNQEVEKALEKYNKRKNGYSFNNNEHLQAIIYSLLSNLRPWKTIENKKNEIDEIFQKYDFDKLIKIDSDDLVKSIRDIKCGNISIKKQMNELKDIIDVLKKISSKCKYGTMDKYIKDHKHIKAGYPYYLAKELANDKNEYKLKNMGIVLVCEYFKNIGIDIAKPDAHLKRMFGKNILGYSEREEATPKEIIKKIKDIAENNNISQIEVDVLLWLYCADGYGEICTKKDPKCNECVIKKYCNKNKPNVA